MGQAVFNRAGTGPAAGVGRRRRRSGSGGPYWAGRVGSGGTLKCDASSSIVIIIRLILILLIIVISIIVVIIGRAGGTLNATLTV